MPHLNTQSYGSHRMRLDRQWDVLTFNPDGHERVLAPQARESMTLPDASVVCERDGQDEIVRATGFRSGRK